MRRSVVVGIAAIVIGALAACGGDSGGEDRREWAGSVCTSLADWRSSLTALADVSLGELTAESFRDRLGQAETATQELVDELQALEAPDVERAEEVEQALDDVADGLARAFESLRGPALEAAEAETQAEFVQALAGLTDEFQTVVAEVQETLGALQSASLFGQASADLEEAFEEAEPCRELRGDS